MDIFQQRRALESMEILIDTREQNTEEARRRFERFRCPFSRATLNYGDYTFNFNLPDGQPFLDVRNTVKPPVVIERKASLGELAKCLGKRRKRFLRELQRAKDAGAKVYLLVENATWENLINGKYRSQLKPDIFLANLLAIIARFDVCPVFCKAETTAVMIENILYRELKERLENGEYG